MNAGVNDLDQEHAAHLRDALVAEEGMHLQATLPVDERHEVVSRGAVVPVGLDASVAQDRHQAAEDAAGGAT